MGIVDTLPVQRVRPVLCLPLWLGTLRDASDYGNHATIVGGPYWANNGGIDSIVGVPGGTLSVAHSASISLTRGTLFVWGNWPQGGISNRRLFNKSAGAGRYSFYFFNVSTIAFYDGVSSVSGASLNATGANSLGVTFDINAYPEFYKDGVSGGLGNILITAGENTGALELSNDRDNPHSGYLMYNEPLTSAEMLAIHDWSQARITPRKQWPGAGLHFPQALADGDPLFVDNIQTARVSLANETAGQLSNTGYRIESGAWKVLEDSATGERWIECVTAGRLWRQNLHAYGTIQFGIEKESTLLSNIQFLSLDKLATGSGYDLEFLGTMSVGLIRTGASTLMRSSAGYIAPDTRYDIRITRSSVGEFTLYILGGAFTEWTLVDSSGAGTNPVTNNVWTTNQYTVFDFDAGDRLYLDRQYQGIVAP